jgi:predicted AAA+ superfamily ATPase
VEAIEDTLKIHRRGMNFQGGISRPGHANRVRSLLQHAPVVAILGPRQNGMATLS